MCVKKVSVRDEVYERLILVKDEKGFTSISDTILWLMEMAQVGAKIEELARQLRSLQSKPAPQASSGWKHVNDKQHYAPKKEKPDPSRKIAQDKIVCMSELAGRVHSPERLLQWYRKADNAVVIESDHDTCIVEREFLLNFLNNLDGIRDESEEFTGIVDAREKRLAKFLYESGIIYRAPDGWRLVDETFLNEVASGSK